MTDEKRVDEVEYKESWEDSSSDEGEAPVVEEIVKKIPEVIAPVKQEEVPEDPIERKLYEQKLIEEADEELMKDLFAGCTRPAPAAPKNEKAAPKVITETATDLSTSFSLKNHGQTEQTALALTQMIRDSPAKSTTWLRFLDILLRECSLKMEKKDLLTLQNKVKQCLKDKDTANAAAQMKKKKPNDAKGSIKNYEDEMDMMYGEQEESGEGSEEDYYADFM